MAQTAARTGPGPTVMVALEQRFPQHVRIIDDPLAHRILPFGARASVWLAERLMSVDRLVRRTERKMPGLWSAFMCRKRYIDDRLGEAVPAGIDAVVNLGAGFDTRAYRLPSLSAVPVWEVDQPQNIAAKRSRLERILDGIPPHVTLVPIDFDREVLGDVLASYGYAPDRRTFFVWEAVTQYLPAASVRSTLDFLRRAPAGSRLAFTYVRKDFIDGTRSYGHERLYRRMVLKERSWLFGLDPGDVAGFLAGYGWRPLAHLGYDELAQRYVRPTGRHLLTTALERMVYAEKLEATAARPGV